MKSLKILILAAIVLTFQGVAASPDIGEAWRGGAGQLLKTVKPGAGFSFTYGKDVVGPTFPAEWRQSFDADAKSGAYWMTLVHPSGLSVRRDWRVMPGSQAVEYSVTFKNSSTKVLPPISEVKSLDIAFSEPIADGNCIISSSGGLADSVFPSRSFALIKRCFLQTAQELSYVALTTEGGQSSNKDLPFFFVHNDARQEGVFVAVGWTGQWAAFAFYNGITGSLELRGKIPDLNIALEPGEEIKGPSILIGLYQGEMSDGSNRLRRLIRDSYTPKLRGQTFMPAATYDHFWGIEEDIDEKKLKQLADGAASLGEEYFLLDGGWYADVGEDWFDTVGSWDWSRSSRFPNGLKPVADYVRAKGMQFGMWFEPERVVEGSQLAKEHPDWILWDQAGIGDISYAFIGREYIPGHPSFKKRFGLVDYGRPEVQEWVRNMLDRYINAYGLKYVRVDLNTNPLPYWNAHDKPDRRGVTQIRHVQGYYAILDWLRAKHPDVIFDGCAAGGRRIDLETVRRFHTIWIDDWPVAPAIIRSTLLGLNTFLPGNYSYVNFSVPVHSKDFRPSDLGFQSLFGGAFGVSGQVALWPEEWRRSARVHVDTWKRLRRYLIEDYYPLSGQPDDLESWSGWQFHDPRDQTGFIQTFRTKTSSAAHRFVLKNLERDSRYRFSDVYSGETFERTGGVLTTEGIEIAQEPMTSRVLTFGKIKD